MTATRILSFLVTLLLHGAFLWALDSQNTTKAKVVFSEGESAIRLTFVSRPAERTPVPEKLKPVAEPVREIIQKPNTPVHEPVPEPDNFKIPDRTPAEPPEVYEPVRTAQDSDLRPKGIRREARVLDELRPVYPRLSRKRGEEGQVICRVSISKQGRALAVEVEHSSGYARLDEEAVAALKKAKFEPALDDGVAVTSSKLFTVKFKLFDSP